MAALDTIGIGTTPNDGTGNPLRTAFGKINDLINAAKAAGWTTNGPAKPTVRAATTTTLPSNSYSNGVLTGSANGALSAQDGVTLVAGERLLVKDEASQLKNGPYVLTQVGDGSHPYILTRADDFSTWDEIVGRSVYVEEGSTNADRLFFSTANAGGTLGTTAITYTLGAVSNITSAIWGYLAGTSSYMGGLLSTASAAALKAALAVAFSDLTGSVSVAQMGTATYGPGFVEFVLAGVNFNSSNTDSAVAISLPTGYTRYLINNVRIIGADGSGGGSLTTATFGVFTATGAGGTAIVASGSAVTVTNSTEGTANNAQNATFAFANQSICFRLTDVPTIYFRVQNPQGTARTATVVINIVPLP